MAYYIAFRRIKDHPLKDIFSNTLPQEFIVEYSHFDKTAHNTNNGYEIISAEEFEKHINNNKHLLEEFIRRNKESQDAYLKQRMEEKDIEYAKNKPDYVLYQQFLKWKQEKDSIEQEVKREEIKKIWRKQQGLPEE